VVFPLTTANDTLARQWIRIAHRLENVGDSKVCDLQDPTGTINQDVLWLKVTVLKIESEDVEKKSGNARKEKQSNCLPEHKTQR
jgi:hypothetical protein